MSTVRTTITFPKPFDTRRFDKFFPNAASKADEAVDWAKASDEVKAEGEKLIIETLDSLKEHCDTAVLLEWGTIPLYLFGRYSIDPKALDSVGIGEVIRSVVQQEMLHLALAGNLTKSIGGDVVLYSRCSCAFPDFPLKMPGHAGDFILHLRKADIEQVKVYCEVELPAKKDAPAQPDDYDTIGQFYRGLLEGGTAVVVLSSLTSSVGSPEKNIFDPKWLPYQLAGPDGVYAGTETGGLTPISGIPDVIEACKVIVDQGEGDLGTVDVNAETEMSHYWKFESIRDGGVQPSTLNLHEDPMTAELKEVNRRLYQASRLFDACYSFVLLAMEQTFKIPSTGDQAPIRAGVTAIYVEFMANVLRRIAVFLVQMDDPSQPGKKWAPTFNRFDFYQNDKGNGGTGTTTKPLAQIWGLAQTVVQNYKPLIGQRPYDLLLPLLELLKPGVVFQELPLPVQEIPICVDCAAKSSK